MLGSLLRDAERGEFRDFAAAEQAALAAQSVVVAFETAKQLGDADAAGLRAGVDRVYAAVEKKTPTTWPSSSTRCAPCALQRTEPVVGRRSDRGAGRKSGKIILAADRRGQV